jgi:outer membrane receptor protein involved in Fe transport
LFLLPCYEVKASPGIVNVDSKAAYFQANYQLMDKKDIDYTITNTPVNIGLFIDLNHKKESFDVGVLSPRLGLSYQVNEDSMAYGSYLLFD